MATDSEWESEKPNVQSTEVRPEDARTNKGGTPIYFSSGTETLFGWLHEPAITKNTNLGLVICKPFGHEALCAHRTLRSTAEAVANSGIPTIRFDYLGTGDSADPAEIENDTSQINIWINDVLAAIRALRRLTGVKHVCLLGVRLGALLALSAARLSDAVVSIVLVAPVLDGARYTRELRARALAGHMYLQKNTSSDGVCIIPADSGMEINGFPISRATIEELSILFVGEETWPVKVSSLVIDGVALHSSQSLVCKIKESGADISLATLPGLIEMILQPSMHAKVPEAMISAINDWLHKLRKGVGTYSIQSETKSNELSSRVDRHMKMRFNLVERPVFIDADSVLFGIVTEPHQPEHRRHGVLLLNTGADNHIGANRLHVELARRWAEQGKFVLRIDLSGLGDSDTSEGCINDDVFPPHAPNDIRKAIDFMRTSYNIDYLSVGGICSGAYHALQAVMSGALINQAFLVNPQDYFWMPTMRTSELQRADVVRKSSLYIRGSFSFLSWQKLFRREVSSLKIARVLFARGLLTVESMLREAARRLGVQLFYDLGIQLTELTDRGIKLVFIFAYDEPGIHLLELYAGSTLKRLHANCPVRVIQGGDHTFTQRSWRDVMVGVLSEELFANQTDLLADNAVEILSACDGQFLASNEEVQ